MQLPVAPPIWVPYCKTHLRWGTELGRVLNACTEVGEQECHLHWHKLRHLLAPAGGFNSGQCLLGIKMPDAKIINRCRNHSIYRSTSLPFFLQHRFFYSLVHYKGHCLGDDLRVAQDAPMTEAMGA